jgi:hypothetical protein
MTISIEDHLDTAFKNINEWLKFAEQKNAALILLNGGVIWGMTRFLTQKQGISSFDFYLNMTGYILIIISTFFCLISFMPVLKSNWFKIGCKSDDDNSLFFGDIAKYNANEYLDLIVMKTGDKEYKISGFEEDYAEQIVTNAEIALKKYNIFQTSSKFTMAGIFVFLISISVYLGSAL